MKAPFPYFGGKSKIAHLVWQALGQPRHYIEPFFGSGAVLLARPGYDPAHHTETVNDKDGFVANVWRSLKFSPDQVAEWCDWPINQVDLCARRQELIRNEERLLENLKADPEWHDPVIAGYWIWAASCWIGNGLTGKEAGIRLSGESGINAIGRRLGLSGFADKGVRIYPRPDLTTGQGINIAMSSGIHTWFHEISERLRKVHVTCGDWTIVCGGNWQDRRGIVGIFFDPPYGVDDRNKKIYHQDSIEIAAKVNSWALERGKKEKYRIIITGYEEHMNLLDHGWSCLKWKANGGYGNRSKGKNKNCTREMIYYSPYCVQNQMEMAI